MTSSSRLSALLDFLTAYPETFAFARAGRSRSTGTHLHAMHWSGQGGTNCGLRAAMKVTPLPNTPDVRFCAKCFPEGSYVLR